MSFQPITVEVVDASRVILLEVVGEASLSVEDGPDIALELTLPGVQGPPGPTGPEGPQGPVGPAGAARELSYDFAIPQMIWGVTHDIPVTPSIYAYDTNGQLMEGDPAYPTPTTVTVTWAHPMAGRLVLTT